MIVDSTICFFSKSGWHSSEQPPRKPDGYLGYVFIAPHTQELYSENILKDCSTGFSISPTHEDEFDFLDSLSSLGIKSD